MRLLRLDDLMASYTNAGARSLASSWSPMDSNPTFVNAGPGARKTSRCTSRVLHGNASGGIYVLHAFEKKTRKKGESEHLLVRASAPMH